MNNLLKLALMNTACCGIHKHTKTEHVLDCKVQVNTFQRINVLETIFSDHSAINLEINNTNINS